jgi:DNA-binding transcriptional LysR family regulator
MIDRTKLRKLDFEKLFNFYTVFREGSISRAAENLSKPNYIFYYDLKILEDILGAKLYIGGKKNFVLTAEGKRLADFCKETLDGFNTIVGNKDDFVKGDLVIHTTVTIGLYYFPAVLKIFKEKYPEIKVKLLSGPEYIGSKFHDFDVLVAHYLDNRTDLSQNTIKKSQYGYFASKEYIKRRGEPQSESDLKGHDFLCFSGHHLIPQDVIKNVNIIVESSSYSSLFEMCLNGLGICSLSLDIYEILLKERPEKYSSLMRVLPSVMAENDIRPAAKEESAL